MAFVEAGLGHDKGEHRLGARQVVERKPHHRVSHVVRGLGDHRGQALATDPVGEVLEAVSRHPAGDDLEQVGPIGKVVVQGGGREPDPARHRAIAHRGHAAGRNEVMDGRDDVVNAGRGVESPGHVAEPSTGCGCRVAVIHKALF